MTSLTPPPPPAPPSHRRFDFGVRRLLPEWRALFATEFLSHDLLAAIAVACVAVPLSLAIALASDVPPALGLVTAAIGGIVCALFGGAPLAISGPAAAMAVLVGQIVDQHGLSGLVITVLVAGLLQVLAGVLGFGRFMRALPVTVVHGFTTGIGLLIVIGQLPRALGLDPPDESHVIDVVTHVGSYLHEARPLALLLAAVACTLTLTLPRFLPRVPDVLVAVGVAWGLTEAFGFDVPRLGALPRGLPLPSFPALPATNTLPALLGDALVVFAVATFESLLSASALDRLIARGSHDPDQELVGQGLGNLVSAAFGGIAVTSVIARSSLNVQAGARTRRAALLQGLLVLVAVYAVAPFFATLPIAALGGVLLAVGIRMISPSYFEELLSTSKLDAFVFVVTVAVMLAFDLFVGVQAGCFAALVAALVKLGRTRARIHRGHDGSAHQVAFDGPLTFLSTSRISSLESELSGLKSSHGVVLDFRHVESIDVTAAEAILALVDALSAHGFKVALLAPGEDSRNALARAGSLAGRELPLCTSDADLDRVLARSRAVHAHRVLLSGVERFRSHVRENLSPLLDQLAAGQAPHTFFLTCADSRVSPNLMCSTHPGELFVVRNIGALLPVPDGSTLNDEGAALEYAIRVLGVRNVVICGHSRCGAITALHGGKPLPDALPALSHWVGQAHTITGDLAACSTVDEAAKLVVRRQLDHLRQYPVVADRLEKGELSISGWFYDVEQADVFEWDLPSRAWIPLGENRSSVVPPPFDPVLNAPGSAHPTDE